MRIINKKYLLIILLIGVILTGFILLKPSKEVQLDNVILKQEINKKTYAMYKEESENNYVPVEGTQFPEGYVLNANESKCIDNNGNELSGVLSYEDNAVTITSGKTTYCYLYFDKSLGLEIKDKNPNGLKTDKVRGAMYRFQGQQSEGINNYICFGTSDKDTCTSDTDHYMYRIIGIEASTGRVKVIKKEALNEAVPWWDTHDEDKTFPQSRIYETINETGFLKNTEYVPEGWEEKISNNIWMYGDMINGDFGAAQTGEGLYLTETGQKETVWNVKANEGDPGAQSHVVSYGEQYRGQTIYYIEETGKWTQSYEGKISLMYLYDYHYSVNDEANCQWDVGKYTICKTGWMHLSQNDPGAPSVHEWTMSRFGYVYTSNWYHGRFIEDTGNTAYSNNDNYSIRPVFYINASEELLNGEGTIEEPFLIKN